jgi:hypothetical protein
LLPARVAIDLGVVFDLFRRGEFHRAGVGGLSMWPASSSPRSAVKCLQRPCAAKPLHSQT